MTSYNAGQVISLEAGEDLSGSQYRFIEINASGQAEVCDNINDIPIGILQNRPLAGEAASVMINGTSKVHLGGVVASGSIAGVSANGRCINPATGDAQVGIVLQGGAADELGEVTIQHLGDAR